MTDNEKNLEKGSEEKGSSSREFEIKYKVEKESPAIRKEEDKITYKEETVHGKGTRTENESVKDKPVMQPAPDGEVPRKKMYIQGVIEKMKSSKFDLNSVNIRRVCGVTVIFILALLSYQLYNLNRVIKEDNITLSGRNQFLEEKMLELYTSKRNLQSEIDSLRVERDSLVVKVKEYVKANSELSRILFQLKSDLSVLEDVISEKHHELDSLNRKIKEYETENLRLKETVVELENERETLKNRLKTSLEKEDVSKEETIELHPITVETKSVYEIKPVKGKILEVNKEYDFIVLNIGQKDGLEEGETLFVYRGRKLLGKIIVEKVKDRLSVAKALTKEIRDKVRRGDKVGR